jgi:uroporphyrinogen decarboxylase
MNHIKRIEDLLAGKKPDSPSMNLWKHFPPYDEEPDQLIKKTIQFQERFDWDFVKVTYQGLYSIQDWGSKIKWPERDSKWPDTCSGVGAVTEPSIKRPEDWEKLTVKPMDRGSWADTIAAARGIYGHFKGTAPVVVTVFNPATTAAKMSGDRFLVHLRKYPGAVKKGLDVISETTQLFIEELIKIGVDGIFLATQLGTYDRITEAEYDVIGTPYDLRILNRAGEKMWFNIIHMHGNAPMFEKLAKYPAPAINWHDRLVDDYDIKTGRRLCPDKLLIGGVDEFKTLKNGSEADIKKHLADALEQSGDGRIILAPGCCVPLNVSEDRIELAKKALTGL